MHLSARRCVPPDVLPAHEGYDWLYVLNGGLRLLLGAEDLTIEPGEPSPATGGTVSAW